MHSKNWGKIWKMTIFLIWGNLVIQILRSLISLQKSNALQWSAMPFGSEAIVLRTGRWWIGIREGAVGREQWSWDYNSAVWQRTKSMCICETSMVCSRFSCVLCKNIWKENKGKKILEIKQWGNYSDSLNKQNRF